MDNALISYKSIIDCTFCNIRLFNFNTKFVKFYIEDNKVIMVQCDLWHDVIKFPVEYIFQDKLNPRKEDIYTLKML